MIVRVIFFNVGHGDSVLIEVEKDDGSNAYLAIDCNSAKTQDGIVVPCQEYLKSRGVKRLNGVMVTHFHKDHTDGIDKILTSFDIENIFIPPVFTSNSDVYDKLISKYRDELIALGSRTNEEVILNKASSFAYFLHYISKNSDKVVECVGRENNFRVSGFPESLQGTVLLPLPRVKGAIRSTIEKGNFSYENFPDANDASIAVLLKIGSHKILLAGDSSVPQWREHSRQMRQFITCLDLAALKVLHHGSKHNNDNETFKYFFGDKKGGYAVLSADGVSHPDNEMFDLVSSFGLKPYCTNLCRQCLAGYQSLQEADVPEPFKPYIANYTKPKPIPCQGDVILEIDTTTDNLSLKASTNTPCVYRFPVAA